MKVWQCVACNRPTTAELKPTLIEHYREGWCNGCLRAGLFISAEQAVQYPVARHTDPETSHEAARSVTRVRESQQRILNFLKQYGPHTDEEIWSNFEGKGISPSGARTRRSELVAKGLVRDSGRRETLSTGRRAIVWEAVASQAEEAA